MVGDPAAVGAVHDLIEGSKAQNGPQLVLHGVGEVGAHGGDVQVHIGIVCRQIGRVFRVGVARVDQHDADIPHPRVVERVVEQQGVVEPQIAQRAVSGAGVDLEGNAQLAAQLAAEQEHIVPDVLLRPLVGVVPQIGFVLPLHLRAGRRQDLQAGPVGDDGLQRDQVLLCDHAPRVGQKAPLKLREGQPQGQEVVGDPLDAVDVPDLNGVVEGGKFRQLLRGQPLVGDGGADVRQQHLYIGVGPELLGVGAGVPPVQLLPQQKHLVHVRDAVVAAHLRRGHLKIGAGTDLLGRQRVERDGPGVFDDLGHPARGKGVAVVVDHRQLVKMKSHKHLLLTVFWRGRPLTSLSPRFRRSESHRYRRFWPDCGTRQRRTCRRRPQSP